jgi:hypothetical protein
VTDRTADLIAPLSTDLCRVVPVPLPSVQLRRWGAIGGTALAVTIALGVRSDWSTAVVAWPVIGHTVVLALVAGSGAWAALRLATPGEAVPRAAAWPLAFAMIWLAWVGTEVALSSASGAAGVAGFGWRCIVRAVAGAAVPGAVLLVMVRRAMPLATTPTAVALAASTAAVGELAAEWMCPNTRAMHVFAWHALPLIAIVGAATACAAVLVGRIAPQGGVAGGQR